VRRRVFKFGGASLGAAGGLERAVDHLLGEGGERPVAVVSAVQGATDLLLGLIENAERGRVDASPFSAHHRDLADEVGLASEVVGEAERGLRMALAACAEGGGGRGRDAALAWGELLAAELLVAGLLRRGASAAVGDIGALGLRVTNVEGRALEPGGARTRSLVEEAPGALVVPGFLALDEEGRLITLGRQGSDLTAVWLAAAVGAPEVELHKPVRGVHTADPDLVPGAGRIPALSWGAAFELACCGARVLHRGAAKLAEQERVELHLLSAVEPAVSGTRVGAHVGCEGPEMLALGPAQEPGAVELCVIGRGLQEREALFQSLGETLRAQSIPLLLSRRALGRESLGLSVPQVDGARALRAIHAELFEQ